MYWCPVFSGNFIDEKNIQRAREKEVEQNGNLAESKQFYKKSQRDRENRPGIIENIRVKFLTAQKSPGEILAPPVIHGSKRG